MSRTCVLLMALSVAASGLAGCGEADQVVVYKQGKYQGKPDTKPWDNPAFGGDKAKWESAVHARNLNQNEYQRMQ
jgi:hypothetical protein